MGKINDDYTVITNQANKGAFGQNALPTPTHEQLISGNYPKGRFVYHGLTIAIENPCHTYRTGTDVNGNKWACQMQAHYGYIENTTGKDGDEIDVFFGVYPESEKVYVINQSDLKGGFDEHKIMLGFLNEAQAKTAYQLSYDRGWKGLDSIVSATLMQFGWWLKYGDHTKPLESKNLPLEGLESLQMTQYNWNQSDTDFLGTTLANVLYDLRRSGDDLLNDPVNMADINEHIRIDLGSSTVAMDALLSKVKDAPKRMQNLANIMNMVAQDGITVVSHTISDPFKRNGTTNIAVLFELSDGQTVSVWFHNPDSTPNKLAPMDTLISWRWQINKKDVTVLVAPESGKDLNLRTIAKRIMAFIAKNSAAFQKANSKRAERLQTIATLENAAKEKDAALNGVNNELAATEALINDAEIKLAQLKAENAKKEQDAKKIDLKKALEPLYADLERIFNVTKNFDAVLKKGDDKDGSFLLFSRKTIGKDKSYKVNAFDLSDSSVKIGVFEIYNGVKSKPTLIGSKTVDFTNQQDLTSGLLEQSSDIADLLNNKAFSTIQVEPTEKDLSAIGVANITDLGDENIYFTKNGVSYYSKVGNTQSYKIGEWDFSKNPLGENPDKRTTEAGKQEIKNSVFAILSKDYGWTVSGDNYIKKSFSGLAPKTANSDGSRFLDAKFDFDLYDIPLGVIDKKDAAMPLIASTMVKVGDFGVDNNGYQNMAKEFNSKVESYVNELRKQFIVDRDTAEYEKANLGIEALNKIRSFLSGGQFKVLSQNIKKSEESGFFIDKVLEIQNTINTMPKTYEQDGKGDNAIVYLHYFGGSSDFYITEKDMQGNGTRQAFGLADVFGDGGEIGYININEIVSSGMELDLYWKPKTLAEVKGVSPDDDKEPPHNPLNYKGDSFLTSYANAIYEVPEWNKTLKNLMAVAKKIGIATPKGINKEQLLTNIGNEVDNAIANMSEVFANELNSRLVLPVGYSHSIKDYGGMPTVVIVKNSDGSELAASLKAIIEKPPFVDTYVSVGINGQSTDYYFNKLQDKFMIPDFGNDRGESPVGVAKRINDVISNVFLENNNTPKNANTTQQVVNAVSAKYAIGKSKKNYIKVSKDANGYAVELVNNGGMYPTTGDLKGVQDWLARMMFVGGGTVQMLKKNVKLKEGDDLLELNDIPDKKDSQSNGDGQSGGGDNPRNSAIMFLNDVINARVNLSDSKTGEKVDGLYDAYPDDKEIQDLLDKAVDAISDAAKQRASLVNT